jgi:hypothetical protein
MSVGVCIALTELLICIYVHPCVCVCVYCMAVWGGNKLLTANIGPQVCEQEEQEERASE